MEHFPPAGADKDIAQTRHFNEIASKVSDGIDHLILTYDSKVVATILMVKGGQLLRALLSGGAWTEADVRAVIEGSTKDVYTPTELPVRRMMVDGNDKGSVQ